MLLIRLIIESSYWFVKAVCAPSVACPAQRVPVDSVRNPGKA